MGDIKMIRPIFFVLISALAAVLALWAIGRSSGTDNSNTTPLPRVPAEEAPPRNISAADCRQPTVQPEIVRVPDPIVLRIANSYPEGGGFNWDRGTGTPDEIRFKGQKILSKSTHGTYCCGFTFAVVMRAASEAGLLESKSVVQIRKFQQHWYAATTEAREKQQIFALQWLGIGRQVPLMEALPGDFVRLWHGGSGHSVIFVRWIVENGKKIGLEYRGTQGSTDGIGNRIEYLPGAPGHDGGDFIVERTYVGRLNRPESQR
jgi:hypothetical protein